MKGELMNLNTLKDLYVDVLKDLYDAENQILKALPKMAKAASSTELQEGFQEHLQQSEGHVERLDQVFEFAGEPAKRKKCRAMEGLLEEGKELLESDSDPEVLDAGMIAAAQKVEHYEIAGYGCARAYAQLLGENEAVGLLQQTLDEERRADEKLTELAMSQINLAAEEGKQAASEGRAARKRSTAKAQARR
jgi:ferritin-like metal-binding protein YciE